MEKYDEDISENLFFRELSHHFEKFYEKATTKNWMVCVPQTGGFHKYGFSQEDFENHILISKRDNDFTYTTLNRKEVTICDKSITTEKGFDSKLNVKILFEETFYIKNGQNFRILCIEKMLEGYTGDLTLIEAKIVELNSLRDCINLLWREIDHKVQHLIDEHIDEWNLRNQNLEFESIQSMRDLTSALYTKILQIVLKDTSLKKRVWVNKYLLESIQLSVETYTMHGVYKRVMSGVTASFSREDAQLNKIIRNLSDIQARDLKIKSEFISVLPRARQELSRIDWYTSPLDKIACIQKTIFALIQFRKTKNHTQKSKAALSTDDLLPIIVFLILKIGIPNWLAHLNFMKNFRLAQKTDNAEKDEHGYYIASLEAAIEHIRSGAIMGSSNPESIHDDVDASDISPECEIWYHKREDTCSAIKNFFDLLKTGDLEKVKTILLKTNPDTPKIKEKLCHPLCSCDQCEIERKQTQNEFYPTLNSRDDKGCTALHVAAESGQDKILEFLINLKADVNDTDFRGRSPIHHACQRGHQNISLMLLHHGATVNVVDNDGNSPLHLCALNGHEDCVKALLYFDEYMNGCSIQLNATNDNGDTPLHFAARWGFDDIVKILLEFGACVEMKNKRNQTPLDCSHNSNVLRLLENAFDKIQITENNGFIHIQSTPPSVAAVNKIQESKKQKEISISNKTPIKPMQKVSAKSIEKMDKLMKSIAEGDINLACFYLGLDVEEYLNDTQYSNDNLDPLCHPLCQCEKCIHLQKSPKHLLSPLVDDISVNSVTPEGKTPLHEACLHGHRALVNILLGNGANPNTRTKHQGFSALHIACQHNHLEVAQLLISHEASVNLADALGRTPLHLSCMNGNLPMTRLLTKNGAALNQTSHDGNAPLHAAARRSIFPLVDHLVHEGVDVSITNRQGLTAAELALDESIKRLLRQSTNIRTNKESQ